MKRYTVLISGFLAGILILSSCNQVEETGLLKFGLELSDDSQLKAAAADTEVVAALVTIQDEYGMVVFDKEPLELLRFSDQFVTRSLQLPVGQYTLTEFMLVDPSGEVLWATPVEGSPLAHLVREPLPHFFGIQPDETTSLDIQVVRVRDYTPEDFGYAQFYIGFVDRFCLKVQFDTPVFPCWNDSLPGPDGNWMPWYEPRLIIEAGNRVVLDEPLNEGENHYQVPIVGENYHLTATDCFAQPFYRQMFSLDELMKFRCHPDFPPLVICPETDTGIIITPEGLLQPTIRQGIFGQVTMPVVYDDNSEGYDVYPVVRDIYFFPYDVLDSICTFAPIDCYFPIELANTPPVAIVRSNSDGFFQVPMEVGEYLYLVKVEGGYYIDAYISSHLPGFVAVFPDKVTELSIHLIDCSLWM
jgi:hypothetical protein